MAEYDSAVALVERLISKKGRPGVRLLRVGSGTSADAAKPWKLDAGAATDQLLATVHAVFLSPMEARGSVGQFAFPVFTRERSDNDDSLTSQVTHMVYIAPSELPDGVELYEDAADLLVESGGVRYSVLRCQSYKPGDQTVVHILSVKG